MGFGKWVSRFTKKNPFAPAIIGAAGAAAGSALGGRFGGNLGMTTSQGSKVGGALGGAIGAGVTGNKETRMRNVTGGAIGGYLAGPTLAKGASTGYNRLMGKPQPGNAQYVGGGYENRMMTNRGVEGYAAPQMPTQPSQAGGIPSQGTTLRAGQGSQPGGVWNRMENAMKGPMGQIAMTTAAQGVLGPSQPEMPSAAEWYGPGGEVAKNWMSMGGGSVPGLTFDDQGNLTGVDQSQMPTEVQLAIQEIDQISEQQLTQLQNEAARANMLGSSQYVQEVQRLQQDITDTKKELLARYVNTAMTNAQGRALAGAQMYGQMGSQAQTAYAQEQQKYNQAMQGIGQAVGGYYQAQEAEKQRVQAQAEKDAEREWLERLFNRQFPQQNNGPQGQTS